MIRKLFIAFVVVFAIVSTNLVSAKQARRVHQPVLPNMSPAILPAVSPAVTSQETVLLDRPREVTTLIDKLIRFTCIGKVPGVYAVPRSYCVVFAVCYTQDDETIRRLFVCPAGTVYSEVDVDCVPMTKPNVCSI